MNKLFKKKKKLSSNLRYDVIGTLVYHKTSGAIFKVLNISMDARDNTPFQLMLIHKPYADINLIIDEDTDLVYKDNEDFGWVQKEGAKCIKDESGTYFNVVAKDCYLL